MPNTLAHFGIQGVATLVMLRQADPKWIFVGCIIPDVPWILQRIVRPVITDPDLLYDLRLYTIAQASLICCLLLCGAFAVLSANPGRIFAILSLNSCFHLLLDAFQTKWGNGVHRVVYIIGPISLQSHHC